MVELSLAQFGSGAEGKLLLGRENGRNARQVLGLHKKDRDDATYQIILPNNIWTITSSFFLECFSASVHELGEEGFKRKYIFVASSDIQEDLRIALSDCVKDGIIRAMKQRPQPIKDRFEHMRSERPQPKPIVDCRICVLDEQGFPVPSKPRSKIKAWFKWHFGEKRQQCMKCFKTFYEPKIVEESFNIGEYDCTTRHACCPHCNYRGYVEV